MTWFGSAEYMEAAVDLTMVGLAYLAAQWVSRPHYRHVSHRDLRALAARTVLVAGNQAHRASAPATSPDLQAGLSSLDRGSATHPLRAEPQPAPGAPSPGVTPGAGPKHRAATAPSPAEPSPGGPSRQPVDVVPPDSASTGVQPQLHYPGAGVGLGGAAAPTEPGAAARSVA